MAISRVGNTVDVTTPAWLYELLPFIYLIGGVLAASELDGALAILSGSLLLVAGAQVLWMRQRYRKSMRRPYRTLVHGRG
ncbi:MAG TPA: hypothetical protein VFM32_11335 [Spongiibacteraceae bacterium]|nr:hypothetical protein [Spongiibacteraceae bacterium]